MNKQQKPKSYLDLLDLFTLFLDWSVQTYGYDGFTRAHNTVARTIYLEELENKREDLIQYSILWDMGLWIHDGNYLHHPKETFFDLLEELQITNFSPDEIAPFLVFDEMLFEGKAGKYMVDSFDKIGYYPVLKNKYDLYLRSLINFGELVGEKEILGDTGSSTSGND